MDSTRYARIYEVYQEVYDLGEPARAQRLTEICGDDGELREEVETLISLAPREFGCEDALSDKRIDDSRRQIESLIPIPSSDWPESAPKVVGRYLILRRIGAGGMGTVFEAEQDQPRRRVALKMMVSQRATSSLVSRFRREAEILGRLKHPGIAQIYDAGTIEDDAGPKPFLAMELVEGDPLTKYADAAKLNLRARVELIACVCDAVDYAHQRGVIHRDLKPENILVDSVGRPKVLDFGIARATNDATLVATQVTQDGQLLGTLAYMAPEQLAGEADAVSTRTDVYALGIIAFQLLAGRLPHDVSGLGLSTAVTMLSNDDAPRLGTLAEETRGDVETIIGKALEKDPERRYPTASALATDLRRWCEDRPITARPPCRFYRIQKFSRRNRALVAGTAATILTLIIGIIVALTFASRERTQRQVANANERAARINGIKALAALYRSARSDIEAGRTQDAGRSLELVPPHDRDWVWHHLKRRTPNIVGTTSRIDGPHTKLHRAPSHLAPSGNEVYLIDQGRLRIVDLSGRRAVKTPFPDLELSGISDVSGTRIAVYLRDSSRIIDIADLQHSQPQPGHVYFNDDHQFRLFVHFRELVCHRNDQDALVVNVPDGSIFVGGWNIGQAGQRNVALIPMASSTLNSPTQASLIDLDTGTLIATRNEPKGISRGAVALDPRGNAALIGEGDRVIEFESMTLRPTGRAYHAPAGGTFDNTIGYSQDGAFVWAVKTNDDEAGANELFVWQTDTMDLVRRFAHPMLGFGDALSADGKTFLARTKLEEPWIIDFDEQENRSDFVELEGRASWIYHVALSHDEKLIAAMAPAEDIRIWEASTGRLRIRIERPVEKDPSTLYLKHFHRMQQACLAFSKIGDSLLTTEIDGNQIKLIRINVASGVVTREPQRLEEAYRIIADESGTKLLSQQQFVSNDDWCVIGRKDDGWENRFHSLDLLFGEDGTTLCAAPSADDSLAAVGTLDGAFLVDWRAGKLVRRIYSSFGAYIHAVGYSPDFSLLALGTSDGRIVFLETGYYETIYEFQAHPQGRNFAGREDTEPQYNYIRDIRWSNDGTRLITGSGDGTIRMWDAMRIGERRRREISHVAARSFDRSLR